MQAVYISTLKADF